MRRQHLADAALLAGGGALLASAFLPWARRGPGHSLHGHALVDTVVALGNTVPGMSAARLTVLWYLVPACGALAWLSAGARGPGALSTRIVAVFAGVVALAAFVLFGVALGFRNLGTGAPVALAGAILVGTGAFVAPRVG